MRNSVTLYGKVVSAVEFRSQTNEQTELYECLVEVQNKSIHGGTIRNLGKSLICVVYNYDKNHKSNTDDIWMSLKSGQFVKISGIVVQDRIQKLGTSSILAMDIEVLNHLEDTQGNASVIITGCVYKNAPVLRKFENNSEKLAFLIEQSFNGESMKSYIVSWNNLANYIKGLQLNPGDEVEVIGNLVSRIYRDKNSGSDVNLCEILAKRITVLNRNLTEIPVNE